MVKKVKCSFGKLKSPVRERGRIRRCKLKKKTPAGRKVDRRKSKASGRNKGSQEFHEVRHRKIKAGTGR